MSRSSLLKPGLPRIHCSAAEMTNNHFLHSSTVLVKYVAKTVRTKKKTETETETEQLSNVYH